jgi:hypothetical protein
MSKSKNLGMSIKTKLITSLGVALAPWLLAVPAPAADDQNHQPASDLARTKST